MSPSRSGRTRNSQVSKRVQCDRVVGSVVYHLSYMLGRVNPRREGSSDDYLRELRYNHEDGEEK